MTKRIAALPMYDWPEARAETDYIWVRLSAALRDAGIEAPARLARSNADLPPVPGGIRDGAGNRIAPDPATLPPDGFDLQTLWRHPSLLLAQTCWGPMEQGLSQHVTVIGQPSYDRVEGGQGGFYASALLMRRDVLRDNFIDGFHSFTPPSVLSDISRARGETSSFGVAPSLPPAQSRVGLDDWLTSPLAGEMSDRTEGGVQAPADGSAFLPLDLLRNKRLAYNGADSMSGMIALTRDLESIGETVAIFSELIPSGAHRASIVAVADGRADVCAVDCRSWHMARRFEPRASEVTVVGWTARRKGLPMVTSVHTPGEIVDRLRAVFEEFAPMHERL